MMKARQQYNMCRCKGECYHWGRDLGTVYILSCYLNNKRMMVFTVPIFAVAVINCAAHKAGYFFNTTYTGQSQLAF